MLMDQDLEYSSETNFGFSRMGTDVHVYVSY